MGNFEIIDGNTDAYQNNNNKTLQNVANANAELKVTFWIF